MRVSQYQLMLALQQIVVPLSQATELHIQNIAIYTLQWDITIQ